MEIDELENLLTLIAYARLLKDAKKAGIDVTKLKKPEKISSQLVSARVRAIFKAVFGERKIVVTKERYNFRWCIWIEELEKIYRENEYDFYKFFSEHPDIKKIDNKYDFNFCSTQYFNVFNESQRHYRSYVTEYNSDLLNEIKRYKEFVDAILAIYPEIKRQWTEHQKLTTQQKYDAIVAKKAREVKER